MCEISSGGKQNQASSLDDGLDSLEDVKFDIISRWVKKLSMWLVY